MAQYRYTVVLEPAPEGGFVVTVPALPGLVTQGETRDEALAMAKEAILGYIENLQQHDEEIPVEQGGATLETVAVNF